MSPDLETCEYSAHKYVEYHRGDSNIILSVPHGGSLKPHSIPNRDAGSLVDGRCVFSHQYKNSKDAVKFPVKNKKDLNTLELALDVAVELYRLSGKRPHVVINRLYRGKMDPNRDLEEGTFSVPAAEEAWMAYHRYIEAAQKMVADHCNCYNSSSQVSGASTSSSSGGECSGGCHGIIFDIHGQSHTAEWVELGYTVTAENLNQSTYTPEMTSVYNSYRYSNKAGINSIQDLISGYCSFGALLSAEGYKVVPSPEYPCPAGGGYYSGGFITEMHGSKRGRHFDAIQIESPLSLRSGVKAKDFSQTLAKLIYKFVDMHCTGSLSQL